MIKYHQRTVCILALLILIGCSGGGDRQGLQGTVTLDGEPLAQGSIVFRPMQGTNGPTAGAKIKNGEFRIEPDKGIFIGKFRVEISATRLTGRKMPGAMGGEADETVSIIPSRYNTQSTLIAEVTKSGANQFEFALATE